MRTSFKILVFLFLTFLLLTVNQALTQQTTTIAGKVVDEQTNTTLAGSNVIIEGTNFWRHNRSTREISIGCSAR